MSTEQVHTQTVKENKWGDYKAYLLETLPRLSQMEAEKKVTIEWKEDAKGNPESVTIKNDKGRIIFYEDIQILSRFGIISGFGPTRTSQ